MNGGKGPQPANPALLHRFLGIGQVVVAVALVIARQAGAGGGPQPDSRLPAYVLAGVSFLLCSGAALLLKPQVPRRQGGKTPAAYWADSAVTSKALLLWFILEGASILASVSYFLGGGAIAMALIVLTVAVYWMNGPRVFAGD